MISSERDQYQRLDWSDHFIRDAIRSCDIAGGFLMTEVDMTAANSLLNTLRAEGHRLTPTHMLVKAVALTLAEHPEIHQLVAGSHRLRPGSIDISLSVAGDTALSPLLLIRNADTKSLQEIAEEVKTGAPKAVEKDREFQKLLKRWGWLLPFGFLRRLLIRTLLRSVRFRRESTGSFQISCLPTVEVCVPLLFSTSAILGAGQVKERVVVRGSQPVVRSTINLVCCVDHKVWNGMDASTFLLTLQRILESGSLEATPGTAGRLERVAAAV